MKLGDAVTGGAVTDERPDRRRPFRVGRIVRVGAGSDSVYAWVQWPTAPPVRMRLSRLRLATSQERADATSTENTQ